MNTLASPRRIRRGLIEAQWSPDFAQARRSLPGEFAGASLKPAGHVLRLPGAGPLPGEFAGASLKHALFHYLLGCAALLSPANSPGPH